MRDLMVYAEALEDAADVPVRYYRDDSGLETDAIVELADGRWAAFEFKTSEVKAKAGLASLARLEERVCANPGARVRPPEFTAVITGVSGYAWQAGERSYVIPITGLPHRHVTGGRSSCHGPGERRLFLWNRGLNRIWPSDNGDGRYAQGWAHRPLCVRMITRPCSSDERCRYDQLCHQQW